MYLAVMSGLVATMWGITEVVPLVTWFVAALLLMVATVVMLRGFTAETATDGRMSTWAWRFAASSAGHGVLWGLGSLLLYDPAIGPVAMAPLLFAIGFSVAASHAKVALPLCAFLTFMPGLGLSALAVARHDAPGNIFMAGFLIVLAMFGTVFSLRSYRLLVETLRLNLVNAELAEEMGQAHRRAERASAAKSNFLTVLSHEVRTPLNAMMGMIEVLRDGRLDPRSRKQIGTLAAAASHIHSMVEDILDFSRIEAGETVLHPTVFDLTALIEDTAELFRDAAAAKGCRLEVRRSPGCGGHRFGDERRLRQVFVNLLDNAVKHTSLGVIRLTVECEESELSVGVEDDGPGIPRELWESVFEPFVRASGSREGAGLGLAICRQLVGLMGGRIWIEAVPKGTRFRFTVTMAPAAAPEGERPGPALPLFDGRVLVVEDSGVGREAIAAMVANLGARVDQAADGEQAVARVARQRYDLVLMDLQLPGIDGRRAVAEIRAVEAEVGMSPVPVVLMTAGVVVGAGEAAADGFAAVLRKPFQVAGLAAVMSRHLAQSSATAGGERPANGLTVEGVYRQCREEVAALRQAVERSDAVRTAALAHRLRGMADIFAMTKVAKSAAALETMGLGDGLAAALVELERAVAQERPQIPTHIEDSRPAEPAIRVLVVDDHDLVREGLRLILNSQPDFTVVGEAADGIACVKALTTLRPSLVLLDLAMPNMGGAEVVSEIRKRSPGTRIVVLTAATSPVVIRNAANAGVDALVNKEVPADELIRTLRAVMAGARPSQPRPTVDGPALSRRERQVMQLIVEGRRTREIAEALGLSERTVEKHRASLARKMGTSTPAELARLALLHGFVA